MLRPVPGPEDCEMLSSDANCQCIELPRVWPCGQEKQMGAKEEY